MPVQFTSYVPNNPNITDSNNRQQFRKDAGEVASETNKLGTTPTKASDKSKDEYRKDEDGKIRATGEKRSNSILSWLFDWLLPKYNKVGYQKQKKFDNSPKTQEKKTGGAVPKHLTV